MKVNENIQIKHIGMVSHLGFGIEQWRISNPNAIEAKIRKEFPLHCLEHGIPCFSIDPSLLIPYLPGKGLHSVSWAAKLLLSVLEKEFATAIAADSDDQKPGLCVGTSFASLASIGDFYTEAYVHGVNSVSPLHFANTVMNAPTSTANIRYRLKNLSSTISSGFNSSFDAFYYAINFMKRNYLQSIIVGGVEELCYYLLAGEQIAGIVSETGISTPFDSCSKGFIPGEGAALFHLQKSNGSDSSPDVKAEIVGIACGFDPHINKDESSQDGNAWESVMRSACKDAQIEPKEVSFIAASANGTPFFDKREAHAIHKVFGDKSVTAYKKIFGECYGASFSLLLSAACSDLLAHKITGTGRPSQPVEEINIVENDVDNFVSDYVCINSFSRDGNCGSIIIKRY